MSGWAIENMVTLRILVYLVTYDSGWVSLEHLLLSRHSSQRGPTYYEIGGWTIENKVTYHVKKKLRAPKGFSAHFGPNFVASSVGTPLCPCGIAYRRACGFSTSGLFKNCLRSPCVERNTALNIAGGGKLALHKSWARLSFKQFTGEETTGSSFSRGND